MINLFTFMGWGKWYYFSWGKFDYLKAVVGLEQADLSQEQVSLP